MEGFFFGFLMTQEVHLSGYWGRCIRLDVTIP
jgi:hypothetical protein